MRLDIAAQTDIGRSKKNNEDFFGVFREDMPDLHLFSEGALLCVADGLGGHFGGEIASKLAVSLVKDTLKCDPFDIEDPEDPNASGIVPVLLAGIRRANETVHQTNLDLVRDAKPMGTTLLAAVVEDRKVHIANVGDSRCYHIRDGAIIGKTEDHSWVDEQVKLGLMSKSEAESDNRRNFVTRCVGTHPEVDVDSYVWHVAAGDHLLLCTDGLVNMVKDTDIQTEFKRRGTCGEIAHRLVNLANANGGRDNITVIVVHISPSLPRFIAIRTGSYYRKHKQTILQVIGGILLTALGFAAGYFTHKLLG